MTRFRSSRAILGAVALLAAACAGGTPGAGSPTTGTSGTGASSPPTAAGSPGSAAVTVTWWHNADQDPGKTFWQTIADEYSESNPHVTFEIVPTQNEDFKTKLPLALNSGTPPDIFQSWGGGGLIQQVDAGKVKDITADTASWIDTINPGAASLYQIDGKQYGVPYDLGLVGIWYNTEIFENADVTPPETWSDFLAAIPQLKDEGVAPISVGQKDAWTGAFWWEYLAIRDCGKDKMSAAMSQVSFEDPCFVRAGELLQELIALEPFQDGFLATPAQTGAGSSAGLLANGKAAMELQGHWEPGVMANLTEPPGGLGDKLGWFPFPAVDGGAGAITEGLGGGNGFAVSADAPADAVGFLEYLASTDVMTRRAGLNDGILPTTIGTEEAITDPNLADLVARRSESTFVQLYLDQAFSQEVGQAINEAVAGLFAGELSPDEVQQAIQDATAQ
jgi:raffinose/stachyose/melibiose transport system substrate-binding protein